MELLKKVTSEHSSQLSEIKKNVATIDEIKQLLSRWMQKQGLDWDENDDIGSGEGSGTNIKNDECRSWATKVEMPSFEGHDPLGWIARAEKFFEVQQVKPAEKVQMAFICMEGSAVHWFRFLRKKMPSLTWEELTSALIQ